VTRSTGTGIQKQSAADIREELIRAGATMTVSLAEIERRLAAADRDS
jgi:hypothetical protein